MPATRVRSHDANLFVVQATRFQQHTVGNSNLAYVMQIRCELQRRQIARRHCAGAASLQRECASPSAMCGGVLVTLAKCSEDRGGFSGKVCHRRTRSIGSDFMRPHGFDRLHRCIDGSAIESQRDVADSRKQHDRPGLALRPERALQLVGVEQFVIRSAQH
jgi:hypothetical protein